MTEVEGRWLVWLVLAAAAIGHGGIHIAIYNRINGLGWPRRRIKRLVKVFFVNTIVLPVLIGWMNAEALTELLKGRGDWGTLHPLAFGYGIVCLSSWVWLGVPWLVFRPVFGVGWVQAKLSRNVIDVQQAVGRRLALTSKAAFESQLPLNQLLELSVEQVELPVRGLPAGLDGYRIAHLSDIHLTGEIHADYSRFVIEQATQARPDLIALTGDIIDHQSCIDWLPEIFGDAEAPDGCYFILGNHDTRVSDSWETRRSMDQAGWVDLGSHILRVPLRGVTCDIIGNEYPWFERPDRVPSDAEFRVLLSHSPDQFRWASEQGIELMLAGHTHGGQGRLPLVGPILSPSFHGSRYASGQFYRAPTTMHVTRGLGGVHLLRINCRPELSLLTLRAESR